MSAGLAWVIAGLLACGAELLHPGVFLLWIGLGACGTGIVTLLTGLALPAELGVFAGLVSVLLAIPFWRHRRNRPIDFVNAPEADLLGQRCEALEFRGAHGRVRLRDGAWQARMLDGSQPAPGSCLSVVGVEGTTLLVAGLVDDALPPAR